MGKLILLGATGQTVTVSKRFNDNDFVYPNDLAEFYDLVGRGIRHCSEKTVIFCGICRDVLDTIEKNIEFIDVLGKHFKSYLVILFESDSTDGTPQKIEELSETYPIVFNSEKLNLPRYFNDEKERTRALAYCRNWYLEYIRLNQLSADYVVVVDLDSSGWSLPGFFHTFAHDFDMMGANGFQNGEYYDTFPLRITGWDDFYFRGLENKQAKVARHLVYSRNDKPQKVMSCFGGLGIYKFEAITSSYYGEFDGSEHVYLHRQMIDNGYSKIYINPSMISLR